MIHFDLMNYAFAKLVVAWQSDLNLHNLTALFYRIGPHTNTRLLTSNSQMYLLFSLKCKIKNNILMIKVFELFKLCPFSAVQCRRTAEAF